MSKVLQLSAPQGTAGSIAVACGEYSGSGLPASWLTKHSDDLSRNVFGVLGLPLDAIGFAALFKNLDIASERRLPFLVSTPNVNFLVKSQDNSEVSRIYITQ